MLNTLGAGHTVNHRTRNSSDTAFWLRVCSCWVFLASLASSLSRLLWTFRHLACPPAPKPDFMTLVVLRFFVLQALHVQQWSHAREVCSDSPCLARKEGVLRLLRRCRWWNQCCSDGGVNLNTFFCRSHRHLREISKLKLSSRKLD